MMIDKLLKYQPYLNKLAVSLTKNEEKAKDLVQETNLKALCYEYEDMGFQFNTWLSKIMVNNHISNLRKKRTEIELFENNINYNYTNDGYQKLLCDDIMRKIYDLPLLELNIIMRRIKGYKYNEIAEEFEMNSSYLRNKMFKIKNKLISK